MRAAPTSGDGEKAISAFIELAKSRRSIRRYRPDPVPEELLQQILEAGCWAPSAVNSQPWEFIVVREAQAKKALYDYSGIAGLKWKQLLSAPVVIVLAAKKLTPYSRDDCIFAAQNIMLCAADLGLGTCYIGGFAEEKIRALLGLPTNYIVPGMITVGYPAENPSPPPRRPLSECVHYDVFVAKRKDLSYFTRILQIVGKLLRLQWRC